MRRVDPTGEGRRRRRVEPLARAAPDGYTLYGGGSQVVTATLLGKVPFDTRKVH